MSAGDIINMAQTAWKIIEDGKPSAQVSGSNCNAVPHVDDWTSLSTPQGTNRVPRRLDYVNGFDQHTVVVDLELSWEWGARYHNGGAFIPNCWLHVRQCDVLWLYNVNLSLQARNPTNAGSESAPKARLPLSITGSVSTPTWSEGVSWEFTLYGDGNWEAHA